MCAEPPAGEPQEALPSLTVGAILDVLTGSFIALLFGCYAAAGAGGRFDVIMYACFMGNPKKLLSLTSTVPCSI